MNYNVVRPSHDITLVYRLTFLSFNNYSTGVTLQCIQYRKFAAAGVYCEHIRDDGDLTVTIKVQNTPA